MDSSRRVSAASRTCFATLMLCLLCAVSCGSRPLTAEVSGTPRLWLWAWERPEDIASVGDARVGVAYFAGTLSLRGEVAHLQRRSQPLRTPPRAPLLAVIRVEPDREVPPRLSRGQLEEAARMLLEVGQSENLRGLQVDFDATSSQRVFYSELLSKVRAGLPTGRILSMTALASWCFGDRWAAGLPVDEVVLMAFRMGPEGPVVRERLRRGEMGLWSGPALSLGLSLDESADVGALRYPRIYLFKPAPWCPTDDLRVWENRVHESQPE